MKHYLSKPREQTFIFLSGMLPPRKAQELVEELYSEVEEESPRWSSYDHKILRCRDLEFLLKCIFENRDLVPFSETVTEKVFSDYLHLGRDGDGHDYRDKNILAITLSKWLNQESVSKPMKEFILEHTAHCVYPVFSSFSLKFNSGALNYAATTAIVEFIKSKQFRDHRPSVKFIYDFSKGLQDTVQIKQYLKREFSAAGGITKAGLFQLYFVYLSPAEAVGFLKGDAVEPVSRSYIYLRMGDLGEKYTEALIQLSEHFSEDRFFLIPALAKTGHEKCISFLLRLFDVRDKIFEPRLISRAAPCLAKIKDDAVTSALLGYLGTDFPNNHLVLEVLQGNDNPRVVSALQEFREKYKGKYQEQKQIAAKYAQRRNLFAAEHLHTPEELYAADFVDAYEKILNE